MGGKAIKSRLSHSVAVSIAALNNFVLLIKFYCYNVQRCKVHLKTKFKCVHVIMCSLVMSAFSRDLYNKNENKVLTVFMRTLFTQLLVFRWKSINTQNILFAIIVMLLPIS